MKVKYIKESFKPVATPFKFESNQDNVRFAFKKAEDLLKDQDQLKALRTSFSDGKYSRVQEDIPVAIKVLKYISALGNYTKDEEHAKIVNGLKDSNIEKKASELLTQIYGVKTKEEVTEDKSIDEYVKGYIKSSGLAPNKEESEKAVKAKEEEKAAVAPATTPVASATTTEEPKVEAPEAPGEENKEPEVPAEDGEETPEGNIDEPVDTNKLVTTLTTTFDNEYKKVLAAISKYPETKQKSVMKEINKQKELFKKELAKIREQETPYSGKYGDTTKTRAESKIKIAKQNAEYLTKGMELKADIKGAQSTASLVAKDIKGSLSKAGTDIKNKAKEIAGSYAVQKAVGGAKQLADKAKNAIKQTTDKVTDKIIANTDTKKLEKITATLGKASADKYKELLTKVDNKTITPEEKVEFDAINSKLNTPVTAAPTPTPAPVAPIAPIVAGTPTTIAAVPAPVAAPKVDTTKAIMNRLSTESRSAKRAKTLPQTAEQTRFNELANKQRTPQEEAEFVGLNKKIEAMKLRAGAST